MYIIEGLYIPKSAKSIKEQYWEATEEVYNIVLLYICNRGIKPKGA